MSSSSRVAGRYRIEHAIAEGGMGAVYRVFDEIARRPLALKRMRGATARQLVALFEREYRTLAGIRHPRIIRVFDYGVDGGEPYYTMELVEGRDLFELAPLPFAVACRYLRDVATCLALLHTRRLLHRDITPRNIRVTSQGECKLLDFGALTPFGIPERVIGTPPFVPPEAVYGAPLDQRSDLFSFGALAYWTLTGNHAYPARSLAELPLAWNRPPTPPSIHNASIPKNADVLILTLLKLEPLARPANIAEVVDRLSLLASLPAEDVETQRALASSYLVNPQFVGRVRELSLVRENVNALQRCVGSSAMVVGPTGAGRSRLLAELAMQAQLLGVRSIQVDAAMHPAVHGTAVALVSALIDSSRAARQQAEAHAALLAQVDAGLGHRLGGRATAPESELSGDWRARTQEALYEIISAGAREQPWLLAIDNADQADRSSLALLAGALRLSAAQPIALAMTARSDASPPDSISWRFLLEKSRAVQLAPLSAEETLTLACSIFGDAPNLGRLAEWLHQRSAGRPLLFVELIRRLFADQVIRYVDGLWVLPAELPEAAVPPSLDRLLGERLEQLSQSAYGLAEALAVQRGSLTRERCAALAVAEGGAPFALIDELVRCAVLQDALDGYSFSSGAFRNELLRRMKPQRHRVLHLRCAEQEQARGDDQLGAQVEAGWHLLQAGDVERGADLLAKVACDTMTMRYAAMDLQVPAATLEAALDAYAHAGRSVYARLPLLAALARAGYYEDHRWALRYGDAAVMALSEITGLDLARKLQPVLGKTFGLVIALLVAFAKLQFVPRRDRLFSFREMLTMLMAVVTTVTGVAATCLDIEWASRLARTMQPFMHLPQRTTPVGVGQFCEAVKEIARENQALALSTWETLTARFQDRRWYVSLPDKARGFYLGGLWFARGVFETFRDGEGALEAAQNCERTGLKLYCMIASQLRFLHYANRGELVQAQEYAEQVELHTIQVGSASQIELWAPAAMILPYLAMADLSGMQRVAERLNLLAERVPSLKFYARLARLALNMTRVELMLLETGSRELGAAEVETRVAECHAVIGEHAPRSFVGWAALTGYTAKVLNVLGQHREARALCERAVDHLKPADRPFVALFLTCEIELAIAEGGMGELDQARHRLDELLSFHAASDNPLTRGRLHEGYARLCRIAEDTDGYRHHLEETRSWYRTTRTPSLIARADALAALGPSPAARSTRRAQKLVTRRNVGLPDEPPGEHTAIDRVSVTVTDVTGEHTVTGAKSDPVPDT